MASSLQIDTRELTRTARGAEGVSELADMPRLLSMLAGAEGRLNWQVRGERRRRPEGGSDELMHLRLQGEVTMQCVRCLGDLPVAIEAERGFRLVASEEQAAREDLEDPEFDVLVGDSRFDLGTLIEDEAIMALPPTPRHGQCELASGAEAGRAAGPAGNGQEGGVDADAGPGDRIRPFAGLADLARKRGH